MRSSYSQEDVVFLLKDITGLVEPLPADKREPLIQAGRHYCEMLPLEYVPSEAYMEAYRQALKDFAGATARAVAGLAEQIVCRRGPRTVLVSLARAGTPVGILLKRCIKKKYGFTLPHYSISIIRGRGIDHNAVKYLLGRYRAEDLLFVDGWTGKGAILHELEKEAAAYKGLSPELAVLADPAGITGLCGTHEDILIPSSCLNSTVSGLVSRTFLRDDIIGKDDFHGAVYYKELEHSDLSYAFIEAIESQLASAAPAEAVSYKGADTGFAEAGRIAEAFGIGDINLVKPGIGETTRVLLRRIPWKILLAEDCRNDPSLTHIIRLAKEKNAPVEYYPLARYKACGLIKKLADT